jgi:RNA polymerase sigma factor (sigma-70 family)
MQDRPFPFSHSLASMAHVPTEPDFATTLERHRDELHRHCVRLTGSSSDGEDALQETLLRAWRSRRTQSSDSPRAWLYRIATNACVDLLNRRDATLASLDERPDAPDAPEERPDEVLVARETVELALLTAIQHLPPGQQTALVMRDVLSWSANDTAAALSSTVPATNSALQRARSGLRARLAPGRLDWTRSAPCATQRRTLDCYLSAIDAPSAETAARLLTDAIRPAAASSSSPS